MRRREFLLNAFHLGGAVACAALGFSLREIAWASNVQKPKKKATGGSCGSCGDNALLGSMTDLSSSTSINFWVAEKATAVATSDCGCRIKIYENADGDAAADATVGWAIYGDSGSGYPNGSNILASGTETLSFLGTAGVRDMDLSSLVTGIVSSTVYWVAACLSTSDPKVEFETGGAGDGAAYMTGETTPGSPPTDWSGSTNNATRAFGLALTY